MNELNKAIYFDMDGTIADLYSVEGWLYDLTHNNARPYKEAKTLVNMNSLAKQLNRLQKSGYKIGVVSWLSKVSNDSYSQQVIAVKKKWLNTHLKSVNFDDIIIVPYGTPKHKVVKFNGVLFDDEEQNRQAWESVKNNSAYDEKNILEILKNL
jgi:histidinol phosphatase-like enzyme